jgi:hypothetical protein
VRQPAAQKTITYGDETRTLREWSILRDIKVATLHGRYDAGTWTPGQMLNYEHRPNPRPPKLIHYDGHAQPAAWWAKRLGIARTTLEARHDAGYPPAQILGFEPLDPHMAFPRSYYTRSDGKSHTMAEWVKILGTKESTLRARRRNGWTPDEVFELIPRRPRTRRRVKRRQTGNAAATVQP